MSEELNADMHEVAKRLDVDLLVRKVEQQTLGAIIRECSMLDRILLPRHVVAMCKPIRLISEGKE